MRSCRSIACLLTRGPRNSADSWQSRKWRSWLPRSLVVKSRDFFLLLLAVYGNVEGRWTDADAGTDAFVCKFGGVT